MYATSSIGTPNQIFSSMQPAVGASLPHVVTNGYSTCSTAPYMAPPVVLDRFDGNILKYPEFKRKFLKFVQSVCEDADIRMSHLEALCIEAKCANEGLFAHPDRVRAYEMPWQRLDDRFGNSTALMNKVRSDLQGPMIKDWDGAELRSCVTACLIAKLCMRRVVASVN